jgi:hypothetical protein
MADLKISALSNNTALDAADEIVIADKSNTTNQASGETEKRTMAQVVGHSRKRRIQSVASASTVTPSWDTDDQVIVTALAANVTLANPTGTPTDGQVMIIRVKDNGTARTIGVGTQYRAIGVTLPTTTVISKTLYLGCKWNAADSKLDVLAVGQEA